MIVVAAAVQVCGHCGMVEYAVLFAVGGAELESGDFGDGVGLVGGLEWAGEQRTFGDGLRRVFGVNTGTAKVKKPLHSAQEAAMDEARGHGDVVVQKVGGIRGVGEDSTDFRGCDEDAIGAIFLQKV